MENYTEYLEKFAKQNNCTVEQAKEKAICKEVLKYYESELDFIYEND